MSQDASSKTKLKRSTKVQRAVDSQDVLHFPTPMATWMVQGTKFIVDKRYDPIRPVGCGAYGLVCAAVDEVDGSRVAIKKITNAFEDVVDAKRILREIRLLAHFDHENIIDMRDLIPPVHNKDFEDVYMVLGFMDTDLHKVIYSKNRLTDEHCQYFIYQTLRGLKYMHSAEVIHRDIKPSNLLVNSNCDLKICDMGLARGVGPTELDYELTEYVVTRWYRAPEIMCSSQQYDHKVDVWSVGCIMAELLGRKPIFPGENYINQLNLIIETLGTPSVEDRTWISNDKALDYINGMPRRPAVPFSKLYPEAVPLALDFLEKTLVFNPAKRLTVDECLQHPYLARLYDPKEDNTCPSPFPFDFEVDAGTDQGIRELMLKEVLAFREKVTAKNAAAAATPTNAE